jgi:isoleucyl-tRNA synthetase
LFYALPTISDADRLLNKYARIRDLRSLVTKQLEEVRMTGKIGSSLQAELDIKASGETFDMLESLGNDLKFIFITSSATVEKVANATEESVIVTPSSFTRCARCWHYRDDVGSDPAHPQICGRCASNLYGEGESRKFA